MTDIKENFSTGLAYLFDSRGVNQAALAVSCGMSPQSITDYKKGRRKGDDIERNKIAFLLGYSEKEIQHLGSLIRSGVPGEKALIMVEEARSVIAAGQYVLPWEQEVAGSNPAAPTNKINWLCRFFQAKKTPDFSNN